MRDRDNKSISSNALAARLILMTVGMFGFGFAMVPVYDIFCEVTGLGGRTNTVPADIQVSVISERQIRLGFDTTVNQYAPWTFTSALDEMTISPGGIYETIFTARNLSDKPMVAQAVPSVTPQQAAKYFKKLECFCFTTQEFAGNEEKQMSVRFIVDSDLPEHIDTITLSYTFFDTARLSDNSDADAHSSSSIH